MSRRAESRPSSPRFPKLRLHKGSGLRRARFNGRDFYFGPEGDADGYRRYKRMVSEYLASDGLMPLSEAERRALSVKELILRYWTEMKRGLKPDSLEPIKRVLKVLRRQYGDVPVTEFGPSQLKALRMEMAGRDWSRKGINEATRRIRTVFSWGVGAELLEPSVVQRLRAVRALRPGEGGRETPPVKPVDPQIVDRTLPFPSKHVHQNKIARLNAQYTFVAERKARHW